MQRSPPATDCDRSVRNVRGVSLTVPDTTEWDLVWIGGIARGWFSLVYGLSSSTGSSTRPMLCRLLLDLRIAVTSVGVYQSFLGGLPISAQRALCPEDLSDHHVCALFLGTLLTFSKELTVRTGRRLSSCMSCHLNFHHHDHNVISLHVCL